LKNCSDLKNVHISKSYLNLKIVRILNKVHIVKRKEEKKTAQNKKIENQKKLEKTSSEKQNRKPAENTTGRF
jgi:hypothetical protein